MPNYIVDFGSLVVAASNEEEAKDKAISMVDKDITYLTIDQVQPDIIIGEDGHA